MFSDTELRHILEKAFTPTLCKCTITADGHMTIELLNPESHAQELKVSGISIAKLSSGRALAGLVRDIKEEAAAKQAKRSDPLKRQG